MGQARIILPTPNIKMAIILDLNSLLVYYFFAGLPVGFGLRRSPVIASKLSK